MLLIRLRCIYIRVEFKFSSIHSSVYRFILTYVESHRCHFIMSDRPTTKIYHVSLMKWMRFELCEQILEDAAS